MKLNAPSQRQHQHQQRNEMNFAQQATTTGNNGISLIINGGHYADCTANKPTDVLWQLNRARKLLAVEANVFETQK